MIQIRSLFIVVLSLFTAAGAQVARAEHAGAAIAIATSAIGATPESKNARSNDVASKYVLESNGDLYRLVGGKKCQVTTEVQSMKVSQHPDDAAMLYFTRKEGGHTNLYVLHNAEDFGDCPKTSRKKIMSDVDKYTVTSNTNTKIVNAALSEQGQFTAWDDTKPVINLSGIKEYQMHQMFGVAGKPFSSYVAFALTKSGYIIKIKGNDVQNSNPDLSRTYKSIKEFKDQNGIN
jgi:hypothetical protein